MQRNTPLKTFTPLKAVKPLERNRGLRQVGKKKTAKAAAAGKTIRSTFNPTRWRPAVPKPTSDALAVRSQGRCEIALPGCLGMATDPCHRIKRGAGGRHGQAEVENNSLSNLMHGCRPCHDHSHNQSTEAYDVGIRLKEGQDPAAETALYRGVPCYLTDAGAVVVAEVAA